MSRASVSMPSSIAFHIEGLREAGDPVPEPSTRAGMFEVGEAVA